nr:LOW QUALITY PROTEIN: lysoplasmalogenase [Helicoverpa armigera]
MISPVDLARRVSAGGRLVPFFKCVCVYFVSLGAGGGAPGPAAAAAKCAPVLCLLLCVLRRVAALPRHKGWYARRVAAGLALSALGDALLVWPAQLAGGMGAFGAAHVAYLCAFARAPAGSRRAGAALLAAAAASALLLAPPPGLRAPAAGYALLLAGMAWRGAAAGGAARAGALLFALSDALLGYGLWGGALPCQQLLVMSTYYLAQLGIALSALDTPTEPVHSSFSS